MPRACDFAPIAERNLIERFFNKLKAFSSHRDTLRQARKIFLAEFSSLLPSSFSTEDRP